MREWIWATAPVATVVYFVIYPSQFGSVMLWLAEFIR
jgi:hypothetical protein